MKLGISRKVITPQHGIWLAGFDITDRLVDGVHDDLYLTAVVLEQEDKRALVIAADILGFGRDYTSAIKENINKQFGFSEDEILLNASHTHSGPQTIENMNPVTGEIDPEYISFLTETIITSVKEACMHMEQVDVYYGKTYCNIGVNRRRIVDGKVEWAPYYDGLTDKDVTVVKFVNKNKVKVVMFNYSCHPSTVGTRLVSADYPSASRKIIEHAFSDGAIALFMQGCCGNIRVRAIENNEFRTGTFEDVEEFGKELGKNVADLCMSSMKKLQPILTTGLRTFELPLEKLPEKDVLEELSIGNNLELKYWAQELKNNYDSIRTSVPYSLQKISLGDELTIIGMDGEVCVEYGIDLKADFPSKTLLVLGYCNGIAGYIPTERMFDEGGYEPDTSRFVYMLPSPFKRDIEAIIKNALKELI